MFKHSKLVISARVVSGIILAIVPVVALANIRDGVCYTRGCIQAAATVSSYIDSTADPCDDFYKFACGNFLKVNYVPYDEDSLTSFTLITSKVQQQLKSVIEEPIQKNELKPFQLLKKMYQACMDAPFMHEQSLESARTILKEAGGWPILDGDSWNSEDFNWITTTYKFRKFGIPVDSFIRPWFGFKENNRNRPLLIIAGPDINLEKTDVTYFPFLYGHVGLYYEYMVDIAVLFGADRQLADVELREALKLEMELAKISLSQEEKQNITITHNVMTVAELQQRYPSIPWLEYLNTFLASHNFVTKKDLVWVEYPDYLNKFEILIKKIDKRVQANYLMWKVVQIMVPYMSETFLTRSFQYLSMYAGKERKLRWKECIAACTKDMSTAVGALYVRKFFNKEAKPMIEKMVEDIRFEFVNILKDNDWMDEKTRQKFIDKAIAMTSEIAYPYEMLNDQKLEEFYHDLEFNENNYIQLISNNSLFLLKSYFKILEQPSSKMEWIERTAAANTPYYLMTHNRIEIPAALIQGVFFDADRPSYMNYGAIGSVIGHEIAHGFGNIGRQFNKEGNVEKWCPLETEEAILEEARCFIYQYDMYSVAEINSEVDGLRTKEENIADNVGIKQAYLAYRKWTKRYGREKLLPGLKYTPNQMFWIAAANFLCSKHTPEFLDFLVGVDKHAPAHFRVVGMLSNSEDFSRDFNCPLGSKMNPRDKCKLW